MQKEDIQELFSIIKDDKEIKQFIKNVDDYELVIKSLNEKDMEIISQEYPKILQSYGVNVSNEIVSITIVKRDSNEKNYSKLKKLKTYIDKNNRRIVKTLVS